MTQMQRLVAAVRAIAIWWTAVACQRLGWHPRRFRMTTGFDGASAEARCRRCGYEGLEDSQGNLF